MGGGVLLLEEDGEGSSQEGVDRIDPFTSEVGFSTRSYFWSVSLCETSEKKQTEGLWGVYLGAGWWSGCSVALLDIGDSFRFLSRSSEGTAGLRSQTRRDKSWVMEEAAEAVQARREWRVNLFCFSVMRPCGLSSVQTLSSYPGFVFLGFAWRVWELLQKAEEETGPPGPAAPL